MPGNSPGTLTLNVDEFVQGPAGRTVVEVAGLTPGEGYDQLVISGTATLGGTLEVQLLEDETLDLFRPQDGTTFRFLAATGGVEGVFDAVEVNTPGISAELDIAYDGQDVMVTVVETTLLGDFNNDDMWTVEDIDLLSGAVVAGTNDRAFDLNGDAIVNPEDVDEFLTYVRSLPGDADLDGTVSFGDFLVVAQNFGEEGTWSQGDFDSNGSVLFVDFLLLSQNFGQPEVQTASSGTAAVPEPNPPVILICVVLIMTCRKRGARARRNSAALRIFVSH